MQNPSLQSLISETVETFENQRERKDFSIEEFLDSNGSLSNISRDERKKVLVALLQSEIRIARQSGSIATAEKLALRFPELGVEVIEDIISLPEIPNLISDDTGIPDHYELIEKIGVGGIGEVWRANDRRMERTLAIKILRPERRSDGPSNQRLRREATLTGNLQHPGVPPVYEQGLTRNGSQFFSMKLVEGKTLSQILRSNETDRTFLIGVFEQVAQTIAYAHSKQVVHRDIKPQNIMVGEFGEVQVMDWGMAKSIEGNDLDLQSPIRTSFVPDSNTETTNNSLDSSLRHSLSLETKHGDIFGTPSYMAPEQARGEIENVGPASDVFSLGALLFEVLTGERLYHEATPKETLRAAAIGNMGPIEERLSAANVETELASVCSSCLETDQKMRPTDAGFIAKKISDYQSDVQAKLKQAEIETAAAKVKSEEQKKRTKTIGLMSTLIAIVSMMGAAGFGWQWNLAKQESESRRIEADTRKKVNDFLIVDFLGSLDDDNRLGNDLAPRIPNPNLTVREVLDRASDKVAERFEGSPDVEWVVREQLGLSYAGLGKMKEAGEHYRIALDILNTLPKAEVDDIHKIEHLLVEVLVFEEKHTEALATMERLVDEFSKTYGEFDNETLVMKCDLSSVLVGLERFEEAEDLIREVVETLELAEVDDVGIEGCKIKWATCLLHLSRFSEAEKTYQSVLNELLKKVEVSKDGSLNNTGQFSDLQDLLSAQAGLALVYEYQGRLEDAESLHKQRLELCIKTKGADHVETLASTTGLAVCYLRLGQYQNAVEVLESKIPLQETAFGPEHEETLRAKDSLASAYTLLKEFEKAEPLFLDSRAALQAKTPRPRLDLTRNSNNLGGLYSRMNRYKDAELLLIEAFDELVDIRGYEHPDTIRTLSSLGRAQQNLKKFKRAEQSFQDAIMYAREIFPPTHPEILLGIGDLISFYKSTDEFGKAIALTEELIALHESDARFGANNEVEKLKKELLELNKNLSKQQ